MPLPEKIQNAPQLYLGLDLYYGAFFDLMTSREGFGDGPISWQAIEEYARLNDYSEEQKEDLHYYITKLDEAYMGKKKTSAK